MNEQLLELYLDFNFLCKLILFQSDGNNTEEENTAEDYKPEVGCINAVFDCDMISHFALR